MRPFSVLVATAVLLVMAGAASGQVVEEWVHRYDGPAAAGEEANGIAVDDHGCVYVAGWSEGVGTGSDCLTIKYDGSGDTLWVRRHNGPGNHWDDCRAITLDADGNVCVTGGIESVFMMGGGDVWTAKYDADGDTLWTAWYNGPADGSDWAEDIAVDAEGHVYVTGVSDGPAGDYDCVTIEYDAGGTIQWAERYAGPADGDDYGAAIAADDSGHVFVAAVPVGGVTDLDFLTIKYDTDGDTLWVRRYDGPQHGRDEARDIAVDDRGNVFVVGMSEDETRASDDFLTIKYRPNGRIDWVARYNGPSDWADRGRAIALGDDGRIYVTGDATRPMSSTTYTTVKYDASGDTAWVAWYSGPANRTDSARDIEVGPDGNIYVTGQSSAAVETEPDFVTIMYNTAGDTLWTMRYDGPSGGHDEDPSIAVGADGNVYVTGTSENDVVTIKYSPVTPVEGWLTAAESADGSVQLVWSVSPLAGAFGLNVYRASGVHGAFVGLNAQPIEFTSSGEFIDDSVWPETTFCYDLRIVTWDGSEEPIEAPPACATTGGRLEARLRAIRPNPCRLGADIEFEVPARADPVRVRVYDAAGRCVRTLFDGHLAPGRHIVPWEGTGADGRRAAAGIYFVRLEAGDARSTRKLVVVR